jgi:hypothetical protein
MFKEIFKILITKRTCLSRGKTAILICEQAFINVLTQGNVTFCSGYIPCMFPLCQYLQKANKYMHFGIRGCLIFLALLPVNKENCLYYFLTTQSQEAG